MLPCQSLISLLDLAREAALALPSEQDLGIVLALVAFSVVITAAAKVVTVMVMIRRRMMMIMLGTMSAVVQRCPMMI